MTVLRRIAASRRRGEPTPPPAPPETLTELRAAAQQQPQPGLIARLRARLVRPPTEPDTIGAIDPTLPATAQVVAVQHPSVTLPERPYDLVLIGAVLALLCLGTVEIYASTAAEGLTKLGNAAHFLER